MPSDFLAATYIYGMGQPSLLPRPWSAVAGPLQVSSSLLGVLVVTPKHTNMNSVTKEEIFDYLCDKNITPSHPDFISTVETFLLEKFGISHHEIEEKSYQNFHSTVKDFQEKLKRRLKGKNRRKDIVISSSRVSIGIFF